MVTDQVRLDLIIRGEVHSQMFNVANISAHEIILGLDWLTERNSLVDWQQGTLSFDWKRLNGSSASVNPTPRVSPRVPIQRSLDIQVDISDGIPPEGLNLSTSSEHAEVNIRVTPR